MPPKPKAPKPKAMGPAAVDEIDPALLLPTPEMEIERLEAEKAKLENLIQLAKARAEAEVATQKASLMESTIQHLKADAEGILRAAHLALGRHLMGLSTSWKRSRKPSSAWPGLFILSKLDVWAVVVIY